MYHLDHTTLVLVPFSPTYGFSQDYGHLLGGVKTNESGHIVSAEAIISVWVTRNVGEEQSEVGRTPMGETTTTRSLSKRTVISDSFTVL